MWRDIQSFLQKGSVRRGSLQDYASKNSQKEKLIMYLEMLESSFGHAHLYGMIGTGMVLYVSYGLQSTAGYGDVNADLSNLRVSKYLFGALIRVEPSTFHIYAGIGTGW